jgi:UDP-2-acetamido-3-amino-2,3-dideoxy-glucuronate N-acetyltransferase
VHPTAVVDEGAQIGDDTRIWHFCHVQPGAVVGQRCILGQNVNVDRDAVIGSGVKIQNNVSIYKGVIVEDDVFLGPSCVFTNVVNPRAFIERKTEFRRTVVGRGASIGANATIVCGHDLGPYCMVGAGAVVTREVPAYALVVGVPARILGWVCRCGERLALAAVGEVGERSVCTACGARYRRGDQGSILPVEDVGPSRSS